MWQAGVYSAVMHYLNAVKAAGTSTLCAGQVGPGRGRLVARIFSNSSTVMSHVSCKCHLQHMLLRCAAIWSSAIHFASQPSSAARSIVLRRGTLGLLAFFLLLPSVLSRAEDRSNSTPPSDIPGPNRLWFLEPFMSFNRGPSKSMEPVTLELRNRGGSDKPIILRVPRAYIAEVAEPDQRVQSYVTLVVYLPDYLPRALADQAGLKTRGK